MNNLEQYIESNINEVRCLFTNRHLLPLLESTIIRQDIKESINAIHKVVNNKFYNIESYLKYTTNYGPRKITTLLPVSNELCDLLKIYCNNNLTFNILYKINMEIESIKQKLYCSNSA